jgi:dienelactone hydrolase
MTTRTEAPTIDVSPRDAVLDHPLAIRLHGFAPNQQVTVRARASTESDTATGWISDATFVTDANGSVDLSAVAPVSGSYSSVDPNGLLWSLTPETSGAGRTIGDGINPITLTLTAEGDGAALATTDILRRAIDPSVTVRAIRESGVVANLFVPAGEGPFPTVVVVGGSGGGFSDGLAGLYASHGYATLSLAYFNVEGLPDELLNIPLEYFDNALNWVKTQPEVDTRRLAVSGVSRGGELSLLLASRHPEYRAVVAYVPSGYLWGAVSRLPDSDVPDAFPSWTLNGKGLPYVERVRNDAMQPGPDGIVALTPAFLRYLENEGRAAAAAIPVEAINGPILLISGKEDALWPSTVFSQLIVDRLQANGFSYPVEHLSYEGAGHTIGPRYTPTTVTKAFHNVRQLHIDLGGIPSAIAAAREDSWPKVLAFLDTHIKSATATPDREPVLVGTPGS